MRVPRISACMQSKSTVVTYFRGIKQYYRACISTYAIVENSDFSLSIYGYPEPNESGITFHNEGCEINAQNK